MIKPTGNEKLDVGILELRRALVAIGPNASKLRKVAEAALLK